MMETEKKARTKKTERKKTAKKATKERAKRKRTKERKKATEKKTTTKKEVIKIKDVRELVDYCKQLGRKPFQGASIDFHPKKPAYVYLPDNSVTKVDTQRLLDFLKERNVRSYWSMR
jgi:ATPase subunit of ABC transporter with duplicated ATPase domains